LGGKIGNSLVEDDLLELAINTLEGAKLHSVNIILPIDAVAADGFFNDAQTQTVSAGEIPDGWLGLDIGPESVKLFDKVLMESETILWNGPMGVFEMPAFAEGTMEIAKSIARATEKGAYSLVGGGDSVAAVNKFGSS
jgi:phosphoglycerate kinase